jgi:hypothetical protein
MLGVADGKLLLQGAREHNSEEGSVCFFDNSMGERIPHLDYISVALKAKCLKYNFSLQFSIKIT